MPEKQPQFEQSGSDSSRVFEQELETLRERSTERRRELESRREQVSDEDVISEQIGRFRKESGSETGQIGNQELEGLVLDLSPESHDQQILQLLALMRQNGIKAALKALEKMNNPHLEDDFHRILVAYVKEGYQEGLAKDKTLRRQLNMVVFEVTLPKTQEQDKEPLKELISSMEQFYAGMRSVTESAGGPNHFAVEIALEQVGSQFSFLVAVPRDREEMFEKQLIAIFPHASVTELKDDYNIFNAEGETVGSYASLAERSILPLKTYEDFDFDPLNSILNGFSKLDHEGEGAAIQLVVKTKGADKIKDRFRRALGEVEKGEPLWRALDVAETTVEEFTKGLKHMIFSIGESKAKSDKPSEPKTPDQTVIEQIKQKLSATPMLTNLRLVASSRTRAEAEDILSDLESAFHQLENPAGGNRLKFNRLKGGALRGLLKDFSYRRYHFGQRLVLNTKELSTFMHFQTAGLKEVSGLKKTYVKTAAPPNELSSTGVVMGVNRHRGEDRTIRLSDDDRLRHFYCIGQTGTGKSTLLKNMAVQDIDQGRGVCVIDPHGSDLEDILAAVPPERYEDVIYFDPAEVGRPMALNMLEYDPQVPEQKTFVVNELFNIFQKLYSAVPESMGPMFEQYFRNAAGLVVEDPDSGNTLLDISRVLSSKSYRDLKLSRCRNPVVVQFWQEVAEKAGGEASLQNIVPYITSKFDVFLANDIMRPIVAQERSSFDMRRVMDEQKILLVNLSKGRLGELNSNLLGLIVVGKILMAALSRGSEGRQLPPFYFYIDEFQNVTTSSISTILSEARKYKLSLTVAHQYIAQLEDSIRDSVFGNVGSMAAFRVGAADGEFLEGQFGPTFTATDLINVQNRNAYLRLLVNGQPSDPFNIQTLPPAEAKTDQLDQVKALSWQKYGRDRAAVEAEIMRKYQDLKSQ